ncbi:La-related protein 6 [Halotydeus destructor]|nr:La-related protein 6 [Halotydeus destructor]
MVLPMVSLRSHFEREHLDSLAPKKFCRDESSSETSYGHCFSSVDYLKYLERRRSSSTSIMDANEDEASRRDSFGQEKDSGVECFEEDFVKPEQEEMARIVAQVEAYFTDENLAKDAFLLKHVRRNKDGLVSLKLVASFRKVKALTKNWKVVAYSIGKASTNLVLNDSVTKVRRVTPFQVDTSQLTKKARTVLVYNIPSDKANVSAISQELAAHGNIVAVEMYSKSTLPEICDNLIKNCPSIFEDVVALVEFEKKESVSKASLALENKSQSNWRKHMKLISVEAESVPERKRQQTREKRAHTVCSGKPSIASPGRKKADDYVQVAASKATTKGFPSSRTVQKPKSKSFSAVVEQSSSPSPMSHTLAERVRPRENSVRQPRGPDGSKGFKNRQVDLNQSTKC